MTADPPPELSLYARLLGDFWPELPQAVRRCHLNEPGSTLRAHGVFEIRHGTNPIARLLFRLLRMPRATRAVETRLIVTGDSREERWLRTFGNHRMITTQRADSSGLLAETLGPLEFRFDLQADSDGLNYHQQNAALRLSRWLIPLPRWISPQVEAREEAAAVDTSRTQVRVTVTVPLAGRLISYEGQLEPEEAGF